MNGTNKEADVGAAQTLRASLVCRRESRNTVSIWRGLKYAGGGKASTGTGLPTLRGVEDPEYIGSSGSAKRLRDRRLRRSAWRMVYTVNKEAGRAKMTVMSVSRDSREICMFSERK